VLLEEIDCSTAKLGAEPKYHYKDIHRGKRRLRPRNWLWEKGFSVIKRPGWFPVNRGRSTVPFSRLFTKNSQKAQPERKVSMPLQLLTVIVLGLKCGSEMNIAVFGHPMLNKQPLEVHIPVRASFAKLFGRVMPFWMVASTLLNLLLLLLSGGRTGLSGAPMQLQSRFNSPP
jgi:hypothetical protein